MIPSENILYTLLFSFVQSLRDGEREHVAHCDRHGGRSCGRTNAKADLFQLMYRRGQQNGIRVRL
jgi:hypothetical protein